MDSKKKATKKLKAIKQGNSKKGLKKQKKSSKKTLDIITLIQVTGTIIAIGIAAWALISDNNSTKEITKRLEITNKIWAKNIEYEILRNIPKVSVTDKYSLKNEIAIKYENTGINDALNLETKDYFVSIKDLKYKEIFIPDAVLLGPENISRNVPQVLLIPYPNFKEVVDSFVLVIELRYYDEYISNQIIKRDYSFWGKEGELYKHITALVKEEHTNQINNKLNLDVIYNSITIKEEYLYNDNK